MNQWLKRALSVLLCMLMLVTLLPGGFARADDDLTLEEITDEDLIAILDETDDDEILIIDEEGEDPDIHTELEDFEGELEHPEQVYGFTELYIEPLYRSVISEEQLAERLSSLRASADLMSVSENSVKFCSTFSAAVTYMRTQMVKRSASVVFQIPTDEFYQYNDPINTLYNKAVEHTSSTTGKQGDALRWGNIGWGVSYSWVYNETQDCYCYEVTFTFDWTTTSTQENSLTTKVDSVMSSLSLDGKTEKQKIRSIHDYICDNVNYDYEHVDQGADYPLQFSAYAAMCKGKAVCQGYAVLFYRMAKEAGLGVRVVTSYNHAWNIVRIGSVYYNIDTTWDGQDDTTLYTWYLKGMRAFNQYNHQRESEYCTDAFWNSYPMVKDSAMDLANLTYTFNTVTDGKAYSKAYNSTPKMLIFGYLSQYSYTAEVLKDFFDYSLGDLKVVVVDTGYFSKDDVIACRNYVGGAAASFCYDESGAANNAMWDYLSAVGCNDSVSYPVIVFIDANNKIQDYRVGEYGPATLAKFVKTYLGVTLDYGAPRISLQPESVTTTPGSTAYFSVEALGHGTLSYQWYYRTSSTGSWKKSSSTSANSPVLAIEATKARSGFDFRCKVTNDYGYKYSNAVKLTVKQPPVITTQPKNATVTYGYTAKFTVKASYATGYQWYYRKDADSAWTKSGSTGATTATLTVTSTAARNGFQFCCKVSNADGHKYTKSVKLTTTKNPVITTQPVSDTYSVGDTAKFTVKASGATTYQWYYRKNASDTWKKSGSTGNATSTLSVGATTARDGFQFRCRVSNSTTGGYKYTNTVTLTIGSVKYRALLVGEIHFSWETANRNNGDVTYLKNMLNSVTGPKGGKYSVTCKYDLSTQGIKDAISSTFAGADSDDVSLFFIATHGVTNVESGEYAGELVTYGGADYDDYMTLGELAEALKAVPGKVIVLLGSCGSGAAIVQNGKLRFVPDLSGESDDAFNEAAIRAFSELDEQLPADESEILPNTGELRSSKFYVMTAAAHQESSYGYEGSNPHNVFPYYFAMGAMGDKPADANGNGTITMVEMFNYIYDIALDEVGQHTQMYPSGSTYALFK